MSAARDAFLVAWVALDDLAGLVSTSKNRPSGQTLKVEADRYTAALHVFAAEIGMNPVHVSGLLQAWRRAGRDHVEALDAIEAGLACTTGASITRRESFR